MKNAKRSHEAGPIIADALARYYTYRRTFLRHKKGDDYAIETEYHEAIRKVYRAVLEKLNEKPPGPTTFQPGEPRGG